MVKTAIVTNGTRGIGATVSRAIESDNTFRSKSKLLMLKHRNLALEAERIDTMAYDTFDRLIHAQQAQLTCALSPAAIVLAYLDWSLHLANSPGRQLELTADAVRQWSRMITIDQTIKPRSQDRRFSDEAWTYPLFDHMARMFLLGGEWLRHLTGTLPGVAASHQRVVAFAATQTFDVFSP